MAEKGAVDLSVNSGLGRPRIPRIWTFSTASDALRSGVIDAPLSPETLTKN